MGLSIPNVKFELTAVYKTYADQLIHAASVSDFLLQSANIPAAGDQVERALRILLEKLLPDRVFVSHGHLVDQSSNVSYQQDVLLAESFYTKSLISTLDGTEFYPYETVFACGEVKKTWSQDKLEQAIKSINRNKKILKRNEIPSDQLTTGSSFIKLSEPVTSNAYRNPLFSFTFSIDFDQKYNPKKLAEIYNNHENISILPNIAVILKRGIYVFIDEDELKKDIVSIKLYPEFVPSSIKCRWALIDLEPGATLAYLVFMLSQHINDTILEKVSALSYGKTLIDIPKTSIHPI